MHRKCRKAVLSSRGYAAEGAFGVSIFLGLSVFLFGQAAGSKTVALRCGNLFDSRGVEGEKIKELTDVAPAGAEVIDLSVRLVCRG